MFLFKSKEFNLDQFENDLKKISSKITKKEKSLRKLRLKKDYYQKIVPIYLVGGYLVYFSYLYKVERIKEHIFILIGLLVLIGLLYYTLLRIVNYLITTTENSIEFFKTKHEDKVKTLKDKSNFDKTKDLLVRFSDGEDIKELEDEVMKIRKQKEEYLRMINQNEDGKLIEQIKKSKHNGSGFYDNLINSIIGDNELGPDRRYALICHNCLSHNGLAPPGKMPEEVKYICPKCGMENGTQEKMSVGEGKPVIEETVLDSDKSQATSDNVTRGEE